MAFNSEAGYALNCKFSSFVSELGLMNGVIISCLRDKNLRSNLSETLSETHACCIYMFLLDVNNWLKNKNVKKIWDKVVP